MTFFDPTPDLDVSAWNLWLEYRKAIKKPLKEFSWPYAQRKLAKFQGQQMQVVEQSIENGWQGLFALKGGDTLAGIDPTEPW